jgi:hypothetical protein
MPTYVGLRQKVKQRSHDWVANKLLPRVGDSRNGIIASTIQILLQVTIQTLEYSAKMDTLYVPMLFVHLTE